MMFAECPSCTSSSMRPLKAYLRQMQDFIRACIGNLDGVAAVEVEPPKGSVKTRPNVTSVVTRGSTQLDVMLDRDRVMVIRPSPTRMCRNRNTIS